MAVDMTLLALRPSERGRQPGPTGVTRPPSRRRATPSGASAAGALRAAPRALAVVGVITGLYSGFLGLGGGFIVVPALTRWFGFPAKRAIGTSLVAIALLVGPRHGHALRCSATSTRRSRVALSVGVDPRRAARRARHRSRVRAAVRFGFAALLVVAAALLALNELGAARDDERAAAAGRT